MKTASGKGGIAISISNLKDLLPTELKWLLPTEDESKFSNGMHSLLSHYQDYLEPQLIRKVCQLSSPPNHPLDWLRGEGFLDYCDSLLSHQYFNINNRSPLYHVLALLETRAEADEKMEIQAAMRQLEHDYPGLDTTPLRSCEYDKPAVVEVVFDPLGSQGQKGYAVRSRWHDPNTETWADGPRCDKEVRESKETGEGEWLEIGSIDPRATVFSEPVRAYAKALIKALDDWDPESRSEIVFLFRLPSELFHYPVERWPKSPLKTLGRDHAVVIAARERETIRACSTYWNGVKPQMDKLSHAWLWFLCHAAWPESECQQNEILKLIERPACPVFTKVPEVALLQGMIDEGLAIALWPRNSEAESAFEDILRQKLKDQSLGGLRFSLRDWRKDPGEHGGIIRHLALLWDDPSHCMHNKASPAEKKRFHPAFN